MGLGWPRCAVAMSAADCSAGSQIINHPKMRPVIAGSPSWSAKKFATCSIHPISAGSIISITATRLGRLMTLERIELHNEQDPGVRPAEWCTSRDLIRGAGVS